MTKKEMTELFSVMLLAWPNAEMFRGGIAKLGPTVELWAACTADVDFWTGQQAVIRLCKTCKFPPTIAEFREQVDAVNADIRSKYNAMFQIIRSADLMYGSVEAYCQSLLPGSFNREVIDRMGGPENLVITWEHNGEKCSRWNTDGLEAACTAVIRGHNAITGGQSKALAAKK